MHPTFAALLMAMLAGVFLVGSMIGLGRPIGGRRTWVAILGAASVVGSTIGAVAVYAAVQHNPHNTIVDHETGWVDYSYLSSIFLSWFVAANLTATLGFAAILGLLKGSEILYRVSRR